MSVLSIRLKDWLIPGPTASGRRYYSTSDGLRVHYDGRRRMWVYERLDSGTNRYAVTGSTQHFQPYF